MSDTDTLTRIRPVAALGPKRLLDVTTTISIVNGAEYAGRHRKLSMAELVLSAMRRPFGGGR